jgi:hypothetical protein
MGIIGFVVIAFIYVILSIIVGFWAEKKHRSYWTWLLISIIVSPFIGALILACIGKKSTKPLNTNKGY